jgi:hypothetical protein
MSFIRLLGILGVLSLIMVPAFSQPSLKRCECMPDDCHGERAENYCCNSSENSISQSCTCPGLITSFSGTDYYDPGYSYFSKSGARYTTRSGSNDLTIPINDVSISSTFPVAANHAGPPDPDVVEYLPSSAKRVLHVLASDGPLTQKDIISRTELPQRMVRYALGKLKTEEMLVERFSFRDARQSLYSLNGMDMR